MKLDWEKIKGNVIHCDTEEKAKELLNVCSNHGCDTQYVEDTWKNYRDIMCYEINIEREDIYYGSIDYFINEEHREVLEFEDIIIPDKPKICEILGVEVNEEFGLKTSYGSILIDSKYYISEDGCFMSKNNNYNSPSLGLDTINGKFKIVKLPKWTDGQKEIFKALKTLGYNYMVRDSDYSIYAFEKKPTKKLKYYWSSEGIVSFELETDKIMNKPHLNFINWEDEEPFEIPEV